MGKERLAEQGEPILWLNNLDGFMFSTRDPNDARQFQHEIVRTSKPSIKRGRHSKMWWLKIYGSFRPYSTWEKAMDRLLNGTFHQDFQADPTGDL